MSEQIDYILGERLPEPGRVIEVAPGILWLRLPLPLALNHVNLYLLDDGDGWTLVDCGIGDDTAKAIWTEILGGDLLGGRPITRIIATHYHPDHVGLAGWLLDRLDAEFWMTRSEFLNARATWLDSAEGFTTTMAAFYGRTGMHDRELDELVSLGNEYRRLCTPIPSTFRRIGPSTSFKIGGREWRPVFGSGHSPEHATLWCEELGILLGGDMLLPRITPIIAVWWSEPEANPLGDFLEFLGGFDAMADDVLVLPAHDRPYRGLKPRVTALGAHHDHRLDLAIDRCREPSTARDVMGALFDREITDAFQTRFAIGESLAHLHLLREQGRITRHEGENGMHLWQAAA